MSTAQEVKQRVTEKMDHAIEHLKRDLAGLRTGRASVALVDGIKVDYYGTMTPLKQVANVATPEARLITIQPWEQNLIREIEKAIQISDLGLTPSNDGKLIRIPLPPLTEERRKDFVKIAKKYGEECKVTIRKARHEALDMLSEMDSAGDASEDDVERAKKKAEETVAEGGKMVDTLVASKEKDILEV